MSQSVNPYLVLDDRLNVHSEIHFGVLKGPQSQNQQIFTAQTKTNNNISVNCLIPSLSTLIDKRVLLRTQMTIQVAGTVADGKYLIEEDLSNFCLGNFPVSHAINTASVSINNTVVNGNYNDQLDTILRQISRKELAAYHDLSPVDRDFYQLLANTGSLSQFKGVNEAVDKDVLPRGAWVLDSISGNTVGAANANDKKVLITFTTTEPIFISPFEFQESPASALSGISTINFNFNLNSSIARSVRYWNKEGATNTSFTVSAVPKADILMTFLSAPPSVMIPLTNIQPYWELPVFKTTVSFTGVAKYNSFSYQSSLISPNCIPDKVFISLRKSTPLATDSDFLFPIGNVNITWGTQSGILASASVQDLYYMSKKAGLQLTWNEFIGVAREGADNVPLVGGMIALDFGSTLAILEDYYAPSSLGSFTFQVSGTAYNNDDANDNTCELLVSFLNSGLFSSTSGTSQQYIGILDKSTVLSTSQTDPITMTEHHRLLGGGWLSKLKSALPTIKTVANALAPAAKKYLSGKDGAVANLATKALGMAGYGMSAGAMSAGAITGGRHPRVRS